MKPSDYPSRCGCRQGTIGIKVVDELADIVDYSCELCVCVSRINSR